MSTDVTRQTPTVVLVHGAFAESASWHGVIERLHERSLDVVAAIDIPWSSSDTSAAAW